MKIENQRRIINIIHADPAPRITIARELGLTQAAVSLIVDELINDGIVIETDRADNEDMRGRCPVLLDINKDWRYIVGVSIDRDGCDVGLVNMKGQIIDQFDRFATSSDYTATLDEIARKIDLLLERNRMPTNQIVGVGVAVPGPFDSRSGQLLNPPGFFPQWHFLNLEEELTKRLSLPVFIEHNSIALVKAEKSWGHHTDLNSFMLINVNAGLGAGLVLGGSVYSSGTGYGGEFGHTSIDINGVLCTCGNRGCLEQYASISAMMHNITRLRPELDSWQEVVDMAYTGDEMCIRFVEEEAKYLSHAINNVSTLLGLDAVIITGKITYRIDMLLDKIRKLIHHSNLTKDYRPLKICTSTIQGNTYISSGAAVVFDRILEDGLFFHQVNKGADFLAESVV